MFIFIGQIHLLPKLLMLNLAIINVMNVTKLKEEMYAQNVNQLQIWSQDTDQVLVAIVTTITMIFRN